MKKLLFILSFALIWFASCDKIDPSDESNVAERKAQNKKPNVSQPAPCGRIADVLLTGVTTSTTTTQLTLSFDGLTGVNNYVLFYQQNPQPPNITNGVTIDGIWYRQASAGFPYLPMLIDYGWSPMNAGVTYQCKVGIYFTNGCYAYSNLFTVNTF